MKALLIGGVSAVALTAICSLAFHIQKAYSYMLGTALVYATMIAVDHKIHKPRKQYDKSRPKG